VSVLGVKASDDNWTLYPSYHNATYCQVMGDRVYVLASGALYSYNKSDNEVRTYDKITTLSDIDISHIRYSSFLNALVIVYSNANIDILYDDESVYNITDFKNKQLSDKAINNIDIKGSTAYLSTSFGVVVLDLENMEFDNTYNTGLNTTCTYDFDGYIYCGTKSGFYYCSTSKNMLDKNNWEVLFPNYNVISLCELNGKLYGLINGYGLYVFNPESKTFSKVIGHNGENYLRMYSSGDEIVASSKNKVTVLTDVKNFTTYTNSESLCIVKCGNTFWDCKTNMGVVECEAVDGAIVTVSTPVVPNSPVRNYCEYMKFTAADKLLVAGGNINYFDNVFYNGTLMEYHSDGDKWVNFPEDTIKKVTGLKYQNICSIDENPAESGHYFAGSFGYGVYEFRNGTFVQHYDFENSPLESAVPGNRRYVRVPTVMFDKDANLWCVNTDVKDILKVLKKDGIWVSLNYKEMEYMATVVKPYIDSRGWLWVTVLQNQPGLFCAKMNNTPFDTSDDVTKKWLHKFTNQDGVSYDIYQLYDIAEDNDGAIWVGTNVGVFVIDNPERFFNDGVFKQIKIARNDGTGLADYFMSGVYIKDIEVDGANRKWIGTNSNGIYLVSADGQETIHHFTTENSPLPSDCIESIAINDVTGEVFIGTDKGIASYRSDATVAADKLEKNNVYAYPNPVRADYSGNISVVGLTHGCSVKIVDAAGYLVNEGVSNGGMYSWNGRNARGEKVASGVYYVLTYDSDGREGVATKILITR
jgi:hypothetical protein